MGHKEEVPGYVIDRLMPSTSLLRMLMTDTILIAMCCSAMLIIPVSDVFSPRPLRAMVDYGPTGHVMC